MEDEVFAVVLVGLPVSTKAVKFPELLEALLEPSVVEGAGRKCPICSQELIIVQNTSYQDPGRTLFLQLRRQCDTSSAWGSRKIDTPVLVPDDGCFTFAGQSWSIKTLVCHEGRSVQMGHHTAWCRVATGEWLHLDGMRVTTHKVLPERAFREVELVVAERSVHSHPCDSDGTVPVIEVEGTQRSEHGEDTGEELPAEVGDQASQEQPQQGSTNGEASPRGDSGGGRVSDQAVRETDDEQDGAGDGGGVCPEEDVDADSSVGRAGDGLNAETSQNQEGREEGVEAKDVGSGVARVEESDPCGGLVGDALHQAGTGTHGESMEVEAVAPAASLADGPDRADDEQELQDAFDPVNYVRGTFR